MKWLERLTGEKKERILILLLVGVLLLVIAVPTGEEGGEATGTANVPAQTEEAAVRRTEEALEHRLREVLAQADGIGKTDVMITLKSDGRRVVEKDVESRQETSEGETASGSSDRRETTVLQKEEAGGERPFVAEVQAPEIEGVLVLAQGMDAVLENEITEAAMALFGIEAHKIKVMKME